MAPNDLPPFNWSNNKHADIWRLLEEMQKPDNAKVILGKKQGDNTSGQSKAKVYGRIAAIIKPEEYKINAKVTTSRVKGKADDLLKKYKEHAAKLRQTGNGVQPQDVDNSTQNDQFLDCYIPATGPDETTTPAARNLWESIKKEFPFFPTLHKMWSERASVTPPTITTGAGPNGRVTVHTRSSRLSTASMTPSTPSIDSQQDASPVPAASRPDPLVSPEPQEPPSPETPTPFRTPLPLQKENFPPIPKLSKMEENRQMLADSVARAKSNVKRFDHKRSFTETIGELSQQHLQAVTRRDDREHEIKRRRVALAERQQLKGEKDQLIELFRLGVISRDKLRKKLKALDEQLDSSVDATSHEPSSDWDLPDQLPSED